MIYIYVLVVFSLMISLVYAIKGPPLLLIPLGFQFLQVSIRAIQSAVTGVPLSELAAFGTDIEPAIYFATTGLLMLSLGTWITARSSNGVRHKSEIKPAALVVTAVLLLIFGHVLDVFQFAIPPAQQVLMGLAGSKHAGLFLLVLIAVTNKAHIPMVAALVLFEIALGMSGFFGEFKLVFYVVFGAILASGARISARVALPGVFIGIIAINLAIFWSNAKVEYRSFLNQDTDTQVVIVPVVDRFNFLANSFMNFDLERYMDGLERLVDRITYVDHLAVVLTRVPDILPHTDGSRTGTAILHVLVPRLLYPSKPPLENDTIATNIYTGLHEGFSSGTSISMGYLTELYIDFGVIGALICMLIIGMAFGYFYRKLRDYRKADNRVNYALCMIVVLPFSVFETALVKLTGSLIVFSISAFILQRWIIPFFWSFLLKIQHPVAHRDQA